MMIWRDETGHLEKRGGIGFAKDRPQGKCNFRHFPLFSMGIVRRFCFCGKSSLSQWQMPPYPLNLTSSWSSLKIAKLFHPISSLLDEPS
jgi:hypothetical protein